MPVDLRRRTDAIFSWLYNILNQVSVLLDAVRGSNRFCFAEVTVDHF